MDFFWGVDVVSDRANQSSHFGLHNSQNSSHRSLADPISVLQGDTLFQDLGVMQSSVSNLTPLLWTDLDFVLENILGHDFLVEFFGAFLDHFVRELSLFWLDTVSV